VRLQTTRGSPVFRVHCSHSPSGPLRPGPQTAGETRSRFSEGIDFPVSRHDQAVCAYHHRNVVETARRIAFGVPEQNSQFQ
jgi:hypothetical protein